MMSCFHHNINGKPAFAPMGVKFQPTGNSNKMTQYHSFQQTGNSELQRALS